MKYSARPKKRRWPRRLLALAIIVLLLLVTGTVIAQYVYRESLDAVDSTDQQVQLVTIPSGDAVDMIAVSLQQKGIVRSAWAFELYVSAEQERGALKAGTYKFSPSESTQEIVSQLSHGKIATNLVTILPGQRLDQVEQTFMNDGYTSQQVGAAFNPAQYSGESVVSIKPAAADLEGLLYPDSFQKATTTSPETIIRESLTEMNMQLTPSIRSAFAREGLTPYQGLTLASIVEQEVASQSDRNQVAQVFLARLHDGMTLGSDVTAYYGAILAGQPPTTTYDSPYNTLLHIGLPPTPISTVSASSLLAVAHPANTSWLYFVTGDNGVTYFSKTLAQQEQFTAQYCHKLCTAG
jgi:UPF0755 protein